MTRGFYLLIAAAALTMAGCHRKTAADASPNPHFDTGGAPGSAADVMAHTAARFGVPVYPNSVADTSHFSLADNVSQTNPRAYLMYMTPDTVDQVVDFYKTRLNMEATDYQGTKQLKGNTSAGAQVTINVGRDNAGNQTRFVVMAFMPQSGSPANMSTVAAASPNMNSPTPVRQSTATQSYTPDQQSNGPSWTFSTQNSQDEENAGGGAIPQPQDNSPQDSAPADGEPGPNDPNNAPTTPPPDDSGNGGDSGPPGDSG